MRFGSFGSAQSSSASLGAGAGQGFHDFIDYNVEAELLGYFSSFLVEHHFTGWSQVSATLNLLTWLAARTKTLRVGTAVLVLPWHNPCCWPSKRRLSTCCQVGGSISVSVKAIATMSFVGFAFRSRSWSSLRGSARFDHSVVAVTRAILPSWTLLEFR